MVQAVRSRFVTLRFILKLYLCSFQVKKGETTCLLHIRIKQSCSGLRENKLNAPSQQTLSKSYFEIPDCAFIAFTTAHSEHYVETLNKNTLIMYYYWVRFRSQILVIFMLNHIFTVSGFCLVFVSLLEFLRETSTFQNWAKKPSTAKYVYLKKVPLFVRLSHPIRHTMKSFKFYHFSRSQTCRNNICRWYTTIRLRFAW